MPLYRIEYPKATTYDDGTFYPKGFEAEVEGMADVRRFHPAARIVGTVEEPHPGVGSVVVAWDGPQPGDGAKGDEKAADEPAKGKK